MWRQRRDRRGLSFPMDLEMSKLWLSVRQKGVVGPVANRRLMLCLKAVRLLLSSSRWLPRRSAGPAWLDFPNYN